jgi:hypothetical protein
MNRTKEKEDRPFACNPLWGLRFTCVKFVHEKRTSKHIPGIRA